MTALAVDETGIAAALGSSGRVRKKYLGVIVEQRDGRSGTGREMAGVAEHRERSLAEQRNWRGGFLKSFHLQIELWDRRSHERQLSFVAHLEVTND